VVNEYLAVGTPVGRELRREPFAFYDRLRAEAPVFHSRPDDLWLVSSHEHAEAALRDERLGMDTNLERFREIGIDRPALRVYISGMKFTDGAEYLRMRRMFVHAFTPRSVRRLVDRIETITRELLTEARGRDRFDLLHDVALRLPLRVTGEMLGMPEELVPKLKVWGARFIEIHEPGNAFTAADWDRIDEEALECEEIFGRLFRDRRANPREDIISGLVHAAENGQGLSDRDLLGQCLVLHIAGYSTTSSLIVNGFLNLHRHPEQYDLLRADPELAANTVEEALRYETSTRTGGPPRRALADVPLGGTVIPRGSTVSVMLISANRDPAVFADPAVFDIRRTDAGRHLAFGAGPRFCAGTHLARAEAATVYRLFAEEFPRLRVDGEIEWLDSIIRRTPLAVPVVWE
jgi:pimeloyl-[acyl-carrier protein] synthase